METAVSASHDRTRYEGRNLLLLLLALFGPAFVLFLKIVCSIAASAKGITPEQVTWLNRAGYVILTTFFLLEIVCARYASGLLRPARTALGSAVQYAGVLVLCLFISYCGAVTCEAFGYVVFLRVAR
jgi:hypothetical protein